MHTGHSHGHARHPPVGSQRAHGVQHGRVLLARWQPRAVHLCGRERCGCAHRGATPTAAQPGEVRQGSCAESACLLHDGSRVLSISADASVVAVPTAAPPPPQLSCGRCV